MNKSEADELNKKLLWLFDYYKKQNPKRHEMLARRYPGYRKIIEWGAKDETDK